STARDCLATIRQAARENQPECPAPALRLDTRPGACHDERAGPYPNTSRRPQEMSAFLASFLVLAAPPLVVESRLIQVAPLPPRPGQRVARHERAIVLIHGLALHPISKEKAHRAELRPWQQPASALVKRLAKEGDVFAFAYAQTVAVEDVHRATDLAGQLRGLRRLGYREIVLLGHSAGGLIARHLVEDVPDVGVTKVIQVCAPNAGSSWAG